MSIHKLSQAETNNFFDEVFRKELFETISQDLSLRTDLKSEESNHAKNNGKIRAILEERPELDLDIKVNGSLLLHTAISARNTTAVELLLEHGANPKLTNEHGQSPTDIALNTTQPKMLNLLGKHGINLAEISPKDTYANSISVRIAGETAVAQRCAA